MTELDSSTATDPIEADTCPGYSTTHGVQRITGTSPKVRAWSCMACRTNWATTVINPALSIVGLLPTPALRTAALLATLRIEVTRRSGKEHTMTVTICLGGKAATATAPAIPAPAAAAPPMP